MSYYTKTRELVLSKGVMVDVEAAGPSPSRFALLSIGACVIGNPTKRFYIELQPDRSEYLPAALKITGLSMERLQVEGIPPASALCRFNQWLVQVGYGEDLLFVAHNAGFDWMFFADYCVRYQQRNHFGYVPFDTKSAYGSIMVTPLPHHAGEDAYLQTLDLLRYYKCRAQ